MCTIYLTLVINYNFPMIQLLENSTLSKSSSVVIKFLLRDNFLCTFKMRVFPNRPREWRVRNGAYQENSKRLRTVFQSQDETH